jgi:hypothetical protein
MPSEIRQVGAVAAFHAIGEIDLMKAVDADQQHGCVSVTAKLQLFEARFDPRAGVSPVVPIVL